MTEQSEKSEKSEKKSFDDFSLDDVATSTPTPIVDSDSDSENENSGSGGGDNYFSSSDNDDDLPYNTDERILLMLSKVRRVEQLVSEIDNTTYDLKISNKLLHQRIYEWQIAMLSMGILTFIAFVVS